MIDPSDPDTINIEGTIRYLEALELDPEEPVVLVLAYQLDSPSIGFFSRQGFVEGWRTIGYLAHDLSQTLMEGVIVFRV
jgi:DCN1-like protein 1/2